MQLSPSMLGFAGRIGRLAFLGLNVLFGLAFGGLFAGSLLLTQSSFGLAAITGKVIAVVGWTWVSAVLNVRRLHDIGWSGTYAVWLVLLGNSSVLGDVAPVLVTLMTGVNLAVLLWLLLKRGEDGYNAYGPPPGLPVAANDAAV